MHKSVLLNETIEFLNIKPGGRYVDGTLGLGGHAEAIAKKLSHDGRLLGLDVDPENLAAAERRLQPFGNLTRTRQVNFRGLQGALADAGWRDVDGMVFDLGVASTQLDQESRGMSFQTNGPLDMRMDPAAPETALSLLHKIDQRKFEGTLREFGEERNAARLSRRILTEVAAGRIKTTGDLARVCEQTVGRHGKTHPATRVFLALRCLVNDEIGALKDMLTVAPFLLAKDGRLAVISFHSIEDRLVKERFRELSKEPVNNYEFSILTKKPVVPSEAEQRENPRSRSAKLRVLVRAA